MKIKLNKKIAVLLIVILLLIIAINLLKNKKPETPKELISEIIKYGKNGDVGVVNYICNDSRKKLISNYTNKLSLENFYEQMESIRLMLLIYSIDNEELILNNREIISIINKLNKSNKKLSKDDIINIIKATKNNNTFGVYYNQEKDNFSANSNSFNDLILTGNKEKDKILFEKIINLIYKGKYSLIKNEYIKQLFDNLNESDIVLHDIEGISNNKMSEIIINKGILSKTKLYIYKDKGELCVGE